MMGCALIRFLGLLVLAAAGGVAPSLARAEAVSTPVGYKDGYLDSVVEERHLRIHEVVLIEKPPEEKSAFQALAFNEKVSREIQVRYDRIFGRTDAERNIDAPSRFDDLVYANGVRVTFEQDLERRRSFGEYMVRRLSEHQFDNFLKSSPGAAPVYFVKENLSNADVKVKSGYKFVYNYSISGNEFHFRLENPLKIENKVTLQMNSIGVSDLREAILFVRYRFAPSMWTACDYRITDGIVSMIAGKQHTPSLATTISGSTYVKDEGFSIRQHRIILGLTWTN